jgi:hypothetical protein
VTEQTPSMGQWARDLAATYRQIAEETIWQPRRDANLAEAHKYEGIANRMDLIPTTEVEDGPQVTTERLGPDPESGCIIVSVGAFGDRRCRTHSETWNPHHDGPWCPGDERRRP